MSEKDKRIWKNLKDRHMLQNSLSTGLKIPCLSWGIQNARLSLSSLILKCLTWGKQFTGRHCILKMNCFQRYPEITRNKKEARITNKNERYKEINAQIYIYINIRCCEAREGPQFNGYIYTTSQIVPTEIMKIM